MLLDFNFKFRDIKKNEMQNEPIAALTLANFLCIKTPGLDCSKAMLWAYKLAEDGKIEIDIVDLEILEKLIKESEFANLAKDQLLFAIKSCK